MINHLLPPILSLQAEERKKMHRQEAANLTLKEYPGRVTEVETVQQGNSPAFRAAILSEIGNGRNIVIDAANGQLISRR